MTLFSWWGWTPENKNKVWVNRSTHGCIYGIIHSNRSIHLPRIPCFRLRNVQFHQAGIERKCAFSIICRHSSLRSAFANILILFDTERLSTKTCIEDRFQTKTNL
jgi:hypothetical protein